MFPRYIREITGHFIRAEKNYLICTEFVVTTIKLNL